VTKCLPTIGVSSAYESRSILKQIEGEGKERRGIETLSGKIPQLGEKGLAHGLNTMTMGGRGYF